MKSLAPARSARSMVSSSAFPVVMSTGSVLHPEHFVLRASESNAPKELKSQLGMDGMKRVVGLDLLAGLVRAQLGRHPRLAHGCDNSTIHLDDMANRKNL